MRFTSICTLQVSINILYEIASWGLLMRGKTLRPKKTLFRLILNIFRDTTNMEDVLDEYQLACAHVSSFQVSVRAGSAMSSAVSWQCTLQVAYKSQHASNVESHRVFAQCRRLVFVCSRVDPRLRFPHSFVCFFGLLAVTPLVLDRRQRRRRCF